MEVTDARLGTTTSRLLAQKHSKAQTLKSMPMYILEPGTGSSGLWKKRGSTVSGCWSTFTQHRERRTLMVGGYSEGAEIRPLWHVGRQGRVLEAQ